MPKSRVDRIDRNRSQNFFASIQLSKSNANAGFVTYEALQGIFVPQQHQNEIIEMDLQNRASGRDVNRQCKKDRLIS